MKFYHKIAPRLECADDVISIIFALPLFISVRSLYDAALALAVFVSMAVLCIGANILFNRFSAEISALPTLIMLCGAVALVFSSMGKELSSNISELCSCSFITAISFAWHINANNSIVRPLKSYAIGLGALLLTGSLREFLISGTLFKGFSENGIHLMTFKVGDYMDSASSFFLIITVVVFFAERFIGKRAYVIDGLSKSLLIASVLAAVLSLIVFGLNKTRLGAVTAAVPYVLAAILFMIFNRLTNKTTSLFISLEMLILSLFITEYAVSLLSLLITSAVVSTILYVAVLLIEISALRERKYMLSHASFIMLLFTYLIEILL